MILLAKVLGQLDYGKQLMSNVELKLSDLAPAKETIRVKFETLRSNPCLDKGVITATLSEADAVQCKLDS